MTPRSLEAPSQYALHTLLSEKAQEASQPPAAGTSGADPVLTLSHARDRARTALRIRALCPDFSGCPYCV